MGQNTRNKLERIEKTLMNVNIWQRLSANEDFDGYPRIIERSNRNITLTLENCKQQKPKKNLDYEKGVENEVNKSNCNNLLKTNLNLTIILHRAFPDICFD